VDQIRFFLFELAKSKFMDDPTTYAEQGEARWDGWFGSNETVYSTHCYVE
jgi:hypothetical protein